MKIMAILNEAKDSSIRYFNKRWKDDGLHFR
jgi:hypothetical protein